MKTSMDTPQKTKPCDPAVSLLGIYQKECNSGYNKGTCTPMFITALFTIAKQWTQPRCPTANEWTNKMWNGFLFSHKEE
jgi:hypothetical protein